MRPLLISAALILAAIATGLFILTRTGLGSRSEPGTIESTLARELRLLSIPKAYKSMRNPIDCSDQVLAEARAHWADHCATCHANNGSGDSMLARTMYPRPPDMRLPATQTQSDGEIYYTINNGVRLTGMPAFGEPGDRDADSWKLVCFIRHLPHLSPAEEHQMEKLNPKTPDEIEEEREEEEFLNGGALHQGKAK
jgi:cytochrome c553